MKKILKNIYNRIVANNNDTRNSIIHLTSVIENGFYNSQTQILAKCTAQSNEAIHQILKLRAELATKNNDDHVLDHQPKAAELTFEETLKRAETDFPKLYQWWYERLMTLSDSFDETIVGNAAHWGDPYSVSFRDFVLIHGKGQMLDVGCGVFGLPVYLQGFRGEQVSGLDPLPMKEKTNFQMAQGISEYLPWTDKSFDTVLSGTSLDHALSLDKSLDEISRVLKDDGTVLLWIGSVPGAKAYTPDAPDYEPVDKFHLFHFDSEWLEPLLNKRFDTVDRVEFWLPPHSHVFYALKLKK